jgi:26S proteasome regulatory subunit N2
MVTRIGTLEYDPVMVVRAQSSAAGVLALLSEPSPEFKQHALVALHSLVPQFWAEISEHIAPMHVFLSSFSSFASQP